MVGYTALILAATLLLILFARSDRPFARAAILLTVWKKSGPDAEGASGRQSPGDRQEDGPAISRRYWSMMERIANEEAAMAASRASRMPLITPQDRKAMREERRLDEWGVSTLAAVKQAEKALNLWDGFGALTLQVVPGCASAPPEFVEAVEGQVKRTFVSLGCPKPSRMTLDHLVQRINADNEFRALVTLQMELHCKTVMPVRLVLKLLPRGERPEFKEMFLEDMFPMRGRLKRWVYGIQLLRSFASMRRSIKARRAIA